MATMESKAEATNNVESRDFLINKTLLQLILEKDVDDFEQSMGSNPGDNYMSIMHAVKVQCKGEQKPFNILIKAYPNLESRREFLEKTNCFGKEYFIYNEWIPKLLELLKEDNNGIKLSVPEFLGGNDKGKGKTRSRKDIIFPDPWKNENFIVMSDHRKNDGFIMESRTEGLDIEHVLTALVSLATLHALSWCYKVKNNIDKLPAVFPHLIDTMYTDSLQTDFGGFMDTVVNGTLSILEEGCGLESPVYKGASKLLRNDIMDVMLKFLTQNGIDEREIEQMLRIREEECESKGFHTDPWLVACHGDYWVNNMLFRHNNGNTPMDFIMLDFQIIRECCPTTDLVYFIFSSTVLSTRKPNEELMLKTYHDTFSYICNKLGCKTLPGFSMNSLRRRYQRGKILGFLLAMQTLTFVLKPENESVELDSMEGDIAEVFGSMLDGRDKNTKLKDRIVELATGFFDDGVI